MQPIVTDVLCMYLEHYWTLQKGWTDGDAIWVVDSDGPRNHVLVEGSDPSMEMGSFAGHR